MQQWDKFNFSDDFQDMILACAVRHPDAYAPYLECLKPRFFNGSCAYDACHQIQELAKKYNRMPKFTTIGNALFNQYASRNPDRAKECVDYIKKLAQIDTADQEIIRDWVRKFAKERAVQNALKAVLDSQQEGKEIKGGIVKLFEKAVETGTEANHRTLGDIICQDIDPDSNLLGSRFLTRAGSVLITGPTGIGKSSLGMQMAISYGLGRSCFGIAPARPLKILYVQAENDPGDLQEMAIGVCKGLVLTDDECDRVGTAITFITESKAYGNEFIESLNGWVAKHTPDIVWIDPLFGFLGDSAVNQEAVSKFLRNGLNSIIQRHRCGLVVIHHTNKPTASTPKREMQNHELAYAAAGSAELSNWPRAVMSIQGTEMANVFRLVLGKRGRRAGLMDADGKPAQSILIKHHPDLIYWESTDADDVAELDEAKNGLQKILTLVPEKKPISTAQIKVAAQKINIGQNRAVDLMKAAAEAGLVYVWERKIGRTTERWYARFVQPANWAWSRPADSDLEQ